MIGSDGHVLRVGEEARRYLYPSNVDAILLTIRLR